MHSITIHLEPELYQELEAATAESGGRGFGPERWAEEAVESALATRRLPRFTRPDSRPQMAADPEGYIVRLPEGRGGGVIADALRGYEGSGASI